MANCRDSPEKERHVEVSKNLLTLRALHLFHMVGSMLVMTASSEMMMRTLSGLELTTFMTNNMTVMLMIRLVTSPIFASISSVVGRLRTLYFSLGVYIVTDLLQVISPTVAVFGLVSRFGGPLTMGPYMQITNLMVADMFSNDQKRIAIEQSKLGVSFMAASLVVPKLNKLLLSIGNRVPFLLAACMRLVETYCFYVCVDETLQNQKRKSLDDIRLSDFSPMKFIKLFTSGTTLCALATIQSLTQMIRTQAFGRITTVIRTEQYQSKWGINERSTYATVMPIVQLPAMLMSGSIYKKYGARLCFYTGYAADILRCYVQQFSYLPIHEYLALPFTVVRMPGDTAINALLRKEAMKQGISKSDFSSASRNLFQINMLISGYIINRLYARAVSKGRPHSMYGSILLFPAVQISIFWLFHVGKVEDDDQSAMTLNPNGERNIKNT